MLSTPGKAVCPSDPNIGKLTLSNAQAGRQFNSVQFYLCVGAIVLILISLMVQYIGQVWPGSDVKDSWSCTQSPALTLSESLSKHLRASNCKQMQPRQAHRQRTQSSNYFYIYFPSLTTTIAWTIHYNQASTSATGKDKHDLNIWNADPQTMPLLKV